MMMMTSLIFFLILFKFLYAIAYLPTIQCFPGLSRNLTICPGVQGVGPLSRDVNVLASYYGVYHVCHLPIFCIISCLHICYLNRGDLGGFGGSEPPLKNIHTANLNSRCSCEDAQQIIIILIKGVLSSI